MKNQDQISTLLQQQIQAKHPDLQEVRRKAGASVYEYLMLRQGCKPQNKALPFFMAQALGFNSWAELEKAALADNSELLEV